MAEKINGINTADTTAAAAKTAKIAKRAKTDLTQSLHDLVKTPEGKNYIDSLVNEEIKNKSKCNCNCGNNRKNVGVTD